MWRKKRKGPDAKKVNAQLMKELTGRQRKRWRRRNENKDNISLPGVQKKELRHNERKEERSGEIGNEEALPVLPEAHIAQRDEVGKVQKRKKGVS